MDFSIFAQLLKERPEISAEQLKKDLDDYYLPYIEKLIEFKKKKNSQHGLLVGVSAIQGAGKTTQGEILEIILKSQGFDCISRSIDDHYLTHQELDQLRKEDPRFIRRGVTHDIKLAIEDLKKLETMTDGNPILVSGYFKGAHHGDGDRFRWINAVPDLKIVAKVTPQSTLQLIEATYQNKKLELPENMGADISIEEHLLPDDLCQYLNSHINQQIIILGTEKTFQFIGDKTLEVDSSDLPNGWRVVNKKPDFIFYDGWMLGARRVEDESVFNNKLPALETEEDIAFAKFINKKLSDYHKLWEMIDFMNVLYVPNYQVSLQWRDQAEDALRQKGEGMSHEEIKQFVYYFWRSVHPAIHIKNLAYDKDHAQQMVLIGDDHSVKEVTRYV